MAIIRKPSKSKFAVISNDVFKEDTLSFAAMGLLSCILSKPDHWEVHPNYLWKQYPGGKHTVYKLINELIEAGFIIRKEVVTSEGHGKIKRTLNYEVYDYTQKTQQTKGHGSETHDSENRNDENRDVLVNTDLEKELKEEKTDNTTLGEKAAKAASGGDESKAKELAVVLSPTIRTAWRPKKWTQKQEDNFVEMWGFYKLKLGMKKAMEAWQKITIDEMEEIMRHVGGYVKKTCTPSEKAEGDRRTQRQHLSTYLNQKTFLDD